MGLLVRILVLHALLRRELMTLEEAQTAYDVSEKAHQDAVLASAQVYAKYRYSNSITWYDDYVKSDQVKEAHKAFDRLYAAYEDLVAHTAEDL